MKKWIFSLLAGAALTITLPAYAHTDDYLDSVETAHGGQLRMAGPYHLELVAKDREIMVYVADHADTSIKTDGGTAKAVIQTGKSGARTTIKLEPAGDNLLKGTGDFSLKRETVVVVFVSLPGQEPQSARFIPLKPRSKTPAKTSAKNPSAGKADGHDHHQHHMHH
jgi:hypothetical protein